MLTKLSVNLIELIKQQLDLHDQSIDLGQRWKHALEDTLTKLDSEEAFHWLKEIQAAGLTPKFARTVGIVVDHRRHGSNQMKKENIKRLNAYKANLILFPVQEDKPKTGEIHDTTEKLTILSKTLFQVLFHFQRERLELELLLLPRNLNLLRSTERSDNLELTESTKERESNYQRLLKMPKRERSFLWNHITSVITRHGFEQLNMFISPFKCKYSSWLT